MLSRPSLLFFRRWRKVVSCSLHLKLLRLGCVTSISLGHNETVLTWTGNSTEIVLNSRLLPASPKEKAGCCRRCVEKGDHFLAGENIHRGKGLNFFNFPLQSLTLGKRICPFLAGKGKSKGGRGLSGFFQSQRT